MKTIGKAAVIMGLAGAVTIGAMATSEARVRPWVAGAAGFAAGAAIGSAAAANSYYYGSGYYDSGSYAPGYYAYDAPGYAYTADPAYAGYGAYAYAPGYSAYGYAPRAGYDGRYRSVPHHYDPAAGYNSNTVAPWQDWKNQGHDY